MIFLQPSTRLKPEWLLVLGGLPFRKGAHDWQSSNHLYCSFGSWGGEPGRSYFGLFYIVLALLGFPCPAGGPIHQETFDEYFLFVFPFPETNEKIPINFFGVGRAVDGVDEAKKAQGPHKAIKV